MSNLQKEVKELEAKVKEMRKIVEKDRKNQQEINTLRKKLSQQDF